MIRPLFFGSTALGAAVFLLARSSAAEELPFACEAGVVLGGADAADVVARGCEVARAKSTSGRVRIGVVATGARVLVTATRVGDASGVEQTARADTVSIEEAIRTVPLVVEAVLPKTPPPEAPPPAPKPLPPPAAVEAAPVQPDAPAPSRTVRVDVKAENGLRLLVSSDGSGMWRPACEGSCRSVELPLDASYRVVDAHGRAVKGFRLDANGHERLAIDVSSRSAALDIVGITAIVAGGGMFIGGVGGQNSAVTWLGLLTGSLGIVGVAVNGASVEQHRLRDIEPAPRPQVPRDARAFRLPLVSVSF